MSFLLDTHGLIWMMEDDPQLPKAVAKILTDDRVDLYVSVVSLWEISIKRNLGKLNLTHSTKAYWQTLQQQAIGLLPINIHHLTQLEQLPFHHRDPFDRIMIAQALANGLTILTRDAHFSAYEVPVRWG
jgi:PIN domain nuclease of toxin-antitoxin system